MELTMRAYLLMASMAIIGLGCFYFIYLVRFESKRNLYTLGLLLAALSWIFASIMEVADRTYPGKLFWYMEQYFSLIAVPPLWLATSGHYCSLTKKALSPMIVPCFVIALALTALFATNPLHSLAFRSLSLSPSGITIKKEAGPLYYAYMVFVFVGGATGLFIIASNMGGMSKSLRRRSWYVFAALAIPLLAGLIDVFIPEALGELDLAPVSAIASCVLLYVGMARWRLMNPLPLAKSDFMDKLADPVIVVDDASRVIYANEQAKALADELIGKEGGIEAMVGSILAKGPGKDVGVGPRVYGASIKSVLDSGRLEIARIVSLHDVTDLRALTEKLETKVRERTADLEILARDLADEVENERLQEAKLSRSLEEKELLLREVNHRVKNNLQVISSLIKLQWMRAESAETKDALESSMKRVQAICLVHDRMFGRDRVLEVVSAEEYLRDIVGPLTVLGEDPEGRVEASVDGGGLCLSLDLAINVGLIVNEAVTNAFKHVFRRGLGSRLSVALSGDGSGGATLTVLDDGPGISRTVGERNGEGLGMSIVRTIAARLGGELSFGAGPGGLVRVSIPRQAGIGKGEGDGR